MNQRTARWLVPAAIALLSGIGAAQAHDRAPLVWLAAVVAVAISAALVVWPVTGLARVAGLLAMLATIAVIGNASSSNLAWFAVCVLGCWAVWVCSVWETVLLLGTALVVLAAEAAYLERDPGWAAWVAGTTFAVGASVLMRRDRALVQRLRAAQAELADKARAEERSRIAREFHDVIGHALTVSLLHISGARLALQDNPEEADRALAEAERLSRQSLAEVRTAVGTIKDSTELTPLPGAPQLDDLVASFRRAGTEVHWQVEGDLSRLTAAEGLTLYRILQEALTNVARHAPGQPATVRVRIGDGPTRVLVDNPGRAASVSDTGNGLDSMRERAEALGGVLHAGPDGAGWRVEAELPA